MYEFQSQKWINCVSSCDRSQKLWLQNKFEKKFLSFCFQNTFQLIADNDEIWCKQQLFLQRKHYISNLLGWRKNFSGRDSMFHSFQCIKHKWITTTNEKFVFLEFDYIFSERFTHNYLYSFSYYCCYRIHESMSRKVPSKANTILIDDLTEKIFPLHFTNS